MNRKTLFGLALITLSFGACQNSTNVEAAAETAAEKNTDTEVSETNMPPAVPEGARVFFANMEDGDTVSSPFLIEFGIEGMEVEPAGAVNEGKGHHHIIINNQYIEFGGTVPADSVNIHYGGGQTSDSLDLNSGNYNLTMQFADGYHRSYGEQMSSTISIVVK